MMLFFVYIVFHVDPASGLPNTINVCVCIYITDTMYSSVVTFALVSKSSLITDLLYLFIPANWVIVLLLYIYNMLVVLIVTYVSS